MARIGGLPDSIRSVCRPAQFDAYRRMLKASMRYAGAVRLDHVLGLQRLYLIPHGMRPSQGAYVRFPLRAAACDDCTCEPGQ